MYLTYVQLFDGEFIKRSIITANAAHRWRIPCSVIKTIPLLFQDDTASSFRVKIFCEDGLGKGGSHTQDEEIPLCEACLKRNRSCIYTRNFHADHCLCDDGISILYFLCLLFSSLTLPPGLVFFSQLESSSNKWGGVSTHYKLVH